MINKLILSFLVIICLFINYIKTNINLDKTVDELLKDYDIITKENITRYPVVLIPGINSILI